MQTGYLGAVVCFVLRLANRKAIVVFCCLAGKSIVGIKLSVNCLQGVVLFYSVVDFTMQVNPRASIHGCAGKTCDAGNLQIVDACHNAI